jgi:hypothetical protein
LPAVWDFSVISEVLVAIDNHEEHAMPVGVVQASGVPVAAQSGTVSIRLGEDSRHSNPE